MPSKPYHNFDVLITKAGEKYQARVIESPAGQASTTFDLPFTVLDLQKLNVTLEEARRGGKGTPAVKEFGQRLFESAFGSSIAECLHRSLDLSRTQGRDLRVRLRLSDVPELAVWPWEYLYDPASPGRFLSRSADTPIIRYMDLSLPPGELKAARPVRILVVISDPEGMPPLDVEAEWNALKGATAGLEKDGLITLIRLDKATLSDLRSALRQNDIHVLHYIGHGFFDQGQANGVLALEDAEGKPQAVGAELLGELLHGYDSLMMVVMNACHGAEGSSGSAAAGIAQTMVQQGVPSVVAMQYEISDKAAKTFAGEFYRAFADGASIEAAVVEARKAIYAEGNEVEWGTPVLYLRAIKADILETPKMADENQSAKKSGGGISISVGGNVTGKINASEQDIHDSGNVYNVGNISGSTGVAIGAGAQAIVNQGSGNTTNVNIFDEAKAKLDTLAISEFDKEDAEGALKKLKEQDVEAPSQDRVDHLLKTLERIAPPVVEVLIQAITNPAAAVGSGLKHAIKAWREARQSTS